MYNTYMQHAIMQAKKALSKGEVPIGAIIVDSTTDTIIAKAHNLTITNNDPTAHAEILAIRKAGEILSNYRLNNCDLYVSLEPCPMCASAISNARIRRLYFGAYDPKSGGIEQGAKIFGQKTCHHKPEIYGGIAEFDSQAILKEFFKSKRV